MKKTTAYARKLKREGDGFYGAEWINTIARCQPYSDELIPGAIGTTQACADKSLELVADAYRAIKSGNTHPNDTDDFNLLAHALGVSEIRAEEIGGDAMEAMMPLLAAGNAALEKVKTRRERFGKWEVLDKEAHEIFGALELYETILRASSPAQMSDATGKRAAWLRHKDADTLYAIN